jgi:chemotaxis protein CheX
MDVQFINPFILATKTVFSSMLGVELGMGKPVMKNGYTTSAEITAFMALNGERNGFVRLGFGKKAVLFVYKTLLGEDYSDIGPEVIDAVGEIANIIAGQARKEIEGATVSVKVEAPAIIVGHEMERYPKDVLPVISLPFSFPVDDQEEIIFADFAFA